MASQNDNSLKPWGRQLRATFSAEAATLLIHYDLINDGRQSLFSVIADDQGATGLKAL
jgi:hypothetical protein